MNLLSSDSEDDPEIIDEHNYVTDAKNLVYGHDEINLENALLLNKNLQGQLLELKAKLHFMLKDCQRKYKRNEQILLKLHKQTNVQQTFNQQTYYFCGAPYFKNKEAFSAPPIADYQQRKKRKELFPMDLMEQKGYWLPRDKINLIQGVKKQMLNYLYLVNKRRLYEIKAAAGSSSREQMLLWEDNATLDEQRLVSLMGRISESDNFIIDWFTISTKDLDARHTPNECIGMWYGYLLPSLNRSPWTPEEEDRLLCIANIYSLQNWSAIAAEVGTSRSAYQCFVYYQTALADRNMIKNVRWTKEEDELLKQLVEKYRIGNIIPWTKISEKIPGRYKAQLYNRYMFSLNPQIDHSKFTVEEDCIIMAAIKEYGSNFQIFPQNLLPGRTMVQIRNRYNNVLKFVKQRDHWTIEHDQKLIKLVEKYGLSDWAAVSKELLSHSRVSCRSRYNTIAKFLQKYPKKSVVDVPRRKREFSTAVTADNWMETIIKQKQNNCIVDVVDKEADEEIVEEDEDDDDESAESREQRLNALVTSELGVQYYEYFKYSFKFRFGRQHIWASNVDNYKLLKIICQILEANQIDLYGSLMDPMFSDFTHIEKKQKILMVTNLFHQQNDHPVLFPPNIRSVLALRGLTIMFECRETTDLHNTQISTNDSENEHPVQQKICKTEKSKDEDSLVEPMSPDDDHLEMFKKRFLSLFRNAALLSKIPLPPNASDELQFSSAKTKTRPKKVKAKKKTEAALPPSSSSSRKPTNRKPRSTINRRKPSITSTQTSSNIPNIPSHHSQLTNLVIEPAVPLPATFVEIPNSEIDYYDTINEVEAGNEPSDQQYHYTLQTESGTFEIRLYNQDEAIYMNNEPNNVEYLEEAIDLTATTSQEIKRLPPPIRANSRKRTNLTSNNNNCSSKSKRLRK